MSKSHNTQKCCTLFWLYVKDLHVNSLEMALYLLDRNDIRCQSCFYFHGWEVLDGNGLSTAVQYLNMCLDLLANLNLEK